MLDSAIKLVSSIEPSAWVTAIATAVLAMLTFRYVRLSKSILEAQSDPCVIVSVIPDIERQTIIQLVIRNIGSGIAYDITFEFSKPLPWRAWGVKQEESKEVELMKSGPLIKGIPALGPGEERRIDWGQYGGLISYLGEESITVTSHFKKKSKQMPPVKSYLDIKSFEGTNDSERPLPKLAREVEKIRKAIEKSAEDYQ